MTGTWLAITRSGVTIFIVAFLMMIDGVMVAVCGEADIEPMLVGGLGRVLRAIDDGGGGNAREQERQRDAERREQSSQRWR